MYNAINKNFVSVINKLCQPLIYIFVRCSYSKAADKLTYVLKFNKLIVEGGGTLKIESNGHFPVVLEGDEIEVQSGGRIDADMVVFRVGSLTVHQEGFITSNDKVETPLLLSFSLCHVIFELLCPI